MTERQEQMIYDEGRCRGFTDGYHACKDELAENVMERIEADGTLVVTVADATKVTRVLVQDDKTNGDLYYADRPRGEWIEHKWKESFDVYLSPMPMHIYECPYCHYRLRGFERTNFCPNCGADMRGEDNAD